MFGNILLAVDGSEHAKHAARVAGDLARTMKSETLRVVVVYAPIPVFLGEPNMQTVIDARLQESNEILEAALAEIGEVACEIHTELLEGITADTIINVASVRQSDLIVMGSRGLGTLAGLLVGSNSQKVVAHAHCPVLIVR